MQDTVPAHVFNPVGVLDGGQEVNTLDMPLPWASQPPRLSSMTSKEVNILRLALPWVCSFEQVCSRGLTQQACTAQTLHILKVFRTVT